MSKIDITNEIASKHLGQKSTGSELYNPDLLVAIPRELNREQYQIKNDNLPFLGEDVWHCYEFSTMTKNNLPISKVLKISYSCKSEFLVESKSLKLYLNSFNMSCFGKDSKECLKICLEKIKNDLSSLLKTKVKASFIEKNPIFIYKQFKNVLNYIDEKSLKIEKFEEAPELLKTENSKTKKYFLKFDSLRSNCRVTHQPDFGDIFIYYKSQKHILEDSLIKYLCSFRKEYHFHEECVEMIYKRLLNILNEKDELFVCALYTRRGGIDINPIRYSKNCSFDEFLKLKNTKILTKYGNKQ